MLILKENAAASVPTPPVGKDTFFIDDSGVPSIKNSAGNITTFPTVLASNSQVVFMNGSSLSGEAALTYDFNNNVLNVTGNIAAGNVKTDNLLYANGSPWDLSDPGGSNTQVQFNDDESFGGSAAFTFNKSTNAVSMTGNLTVGNVGGANLVSANYLTGTLTTAAQPNVTSLGTLTDLSVSGNALISGNLTVDGNLVYVNVETVAVEDPIIQLQTGPNGAAPVSNSGKDVGTALNYYDSQARLAFMGWDVSNAEFAFGSQTSITNEVVTFSTLGNARAQTFKGNVEASGTSNIADVNLGGHIIPTLDETYDLGNSTNRFRDLWISGNSIKIGNSSIKSNATSLILTNPSGGQIVVSGNSISSTTSITNGTSNVNIPSANGNVNTSVNGTANVLVVTATGANVLGTFNATGNANVGNIGATQGVFTNVSGNGSSLSSLTGANVTGAVAYATTANAVAGANVSGEVAYAATANAVAGANVSGQVGNALVAGTVYTNAQPNITSVGTLSSVAVTGNATAGNVYANSGTIGAQTLKGEAGNLSNITGANVSGQVSYAATANAVAGANVSGQVANALVAGTVYTAAQPNITSVGTLTSLGVNGTVTAVAFTANTGVFTGNGAGLTNLPGGNISGQTGNALVAGTVYTNAQPNITSVGTLTSVAVTGDGTFGNVYANSGTIGAAQFKGDGGNLSNITAGNITGQVANSLVSGTVYTNAQPNITSVGTLTSVAVTGNATAGNVYANSGTIGASLLTGTLTTAAQPNITSVGALSSLSVTGNVAAGNLTTTGVLTVSGTGVSSIAGNLDMTSNTIINLANPTNDQDAATKAYVDSVAQGLHVHDSCYVATTGTLDAASGGTVSYNNGSSGVGATLTTTGTYLLIDGANVQTVGTRILVKNEANAVWNGVYTYTSTTVLTRATDFDTSAEMAGGDFLFVTSGSTQADTGWVQTTDNPTPGTSNIVFTQFSGAGTYTAGTGLTLNGSQFSITNTTVSAASYGNGDRVASFTVNAQGQLTAASNVVIAANAANLTGTTLASGITTSSLTTVGTLGSLTVTANVTAGNVYANSGTVGASLLTGTLTTAAQPNVTSLGTLTGLGVNGTLTAVNITANTGVFTGNANGLSSLQGTNVVGTLNSTTLGNSTLYVGTTAIALNRGTGAQSLTGITSIDGYASTVSTAAQPNITSVGTLTSLNSSGNITAPSFVANTGYMYRSINAAVSAAGTVQGNATALTREINVVSTVASGAGVVLPTGVAGLAVQIVNTAANALLVYPASGSKINSLATNAGFTIPAASTMIQFIAISATQWYTAGATYA